MGRLATEMNKYCPFQRIYLFVVCYVLLLNQATVDASGTNDNGWINFGWVGTANANYSTQYYSGLTLALAEVNGTSIVQGTNIRLISLPASAAAAATTTTITANFASLNMVAILGPVNASQAQWLAQQQQAVLDPLPILGYIDPPSLANNHNNYVLSSSTFPLFSIRVGFEDEIIAAVDYATRQLQLYDIASFSSDQVDDLQCVAILQQVVSTIGVGIVSQGQYSTKDGNVAGAIGSVFNTTIPEV